MGLYFVPSSIVPVLTTFPVREVLAYLALFIVVCLRLVKLIHVLGYWIIRHWCLSQVLGFP